MKPGNLFILLLLAFSLLTCEEKTFNELTGEGTLLKEVVADGNIYYKYTYNDKSLIKEEKSQFRFTEHFYNSKNQLTQSDHYWDESIISSNSEILQETLDQTEWISPENSERDSYSTFEYKSNGQLKKSIIRLKNTNSNYSTYVYNDGKIEKRTTYLDNQPVSLEAFYYDQSDNLTKIEKYFFNSEVQPKLATSTEYFYDDKNNPYISFRSLMIPGKHTNKNNIVKDIYTTYSDDGTVEDIQTTEYSYSYNTKDFPIQRSDGFEYTYY